MNNFFVTSAGDIKPYIDEFSCIIRKTSPLIRLFRAQSVLSVYVFGRIIGFYSCSIDNNSSYSSQSSESTVGTINFYIFLFSTQICAVHLLSILCANSTTFLSLKRQVIFGTGLNSMSLNLTGFSYFFVSLQTNSIQTQLLSFVIKLVLFLRPPSDKHNLRVSLRSAQFEPDPIQNSNTNYYSIYPFIIYMFESVASIRKPNKNFTLLHLENNEIYFMSLKAHLLVDASHEQYIANNKRIKGKLHLCSRSIFFEPKNIEHPLLRMKFSSNIFLRLMKNIDSQKLKNLVCVSGNETQLKGMVNKGINFMTEILEKEPSDNKIRNTLLNKLFAPKKSNNTNADKINNCIFIKLQKVFIIYRWPMSPYITEKTDDNFVFLLAKSNLKQQLLRFLKIYDGLLQVDNQTKFIKALIDATLTEGITQFQELYKHNASEIKHILKCRKITPEGVIHGVFGIVKNKILYYPVVNSPEQDILEYTFRDVKYVTRYRYMFMHTALEVWFYNKKRSVLFVFEEKNIRENIYKYLKTHCQKLVKIQMSTVINKWINGQISNFEYLMFLNTQANRSFNDLSQYPVFPWILHDYASEFDLSNYQLYRDLSKPIGAINKTRLQQLKDNYNLQLKDKTLTHPACLYPTHYSAPGYVIYYLIRKIPQFIIKLQNGVFSPSDRIFRSIEQTYFNSLKLNADFKELIPEFYSNQFDFLVNNQKLELGTTPEGQANDDVILPKWASSPQDFLLKMRAALESDYVSAHINQWIDLIFGFKQSGSNATVADNLFYHMTYEQNVKMDRVMSLQERLSIEVQIGEFGQTPLMLFGEIHPTKKTRILRINQNNNKAQNQEKGLLIMKVKMLSQENQRLRQEAEHERYRFTRKLTEKQQLILKSQKEKKKQIQKMKEMLGIDAQNLKAFSKKDKFKNEKQKDLYMRQIEQLLRQTQKQNQKYKVLVDGLSKQVDRQYSIDSNVEGELDKNNYDVDFLNDSAV